MVEEAHQPQPPTARALHLVLIAIIGLAFVGFFVGIRQGTTVPDLSPPDRTAAPSHTDTIPDTAYSDFDRRTFGPNRNWQSSLADVEQPTIDLIEFDDPNRSDAGRRAVLAARDERRAFHGAPPVVPHPIDQMGTASCMACHGDGLHIGRGVRAPMMSHVYMPNCTQCHAEMLSPDLDPFVLAENTFEGSDAPLGGQRAWIGAPPTIPHHVFMRENCMACHGPTGPEPIRTTHPWQTNCMQCHAPSALLDQVVTEDHPSLLSELLAR